jgi:hypothetical protein
MTYMMTVCPGPSSRLLPGAGKADAGSRAAREHAITGNVYGKRD